MTKRIHVIAGVATVGVSLMPITHYARSTGNNFSAFTAILGLVGGYIGSFSPDLDYPKDLARINDRYLTAQQRYFKYNHRSWLHTLIVPAVLSAINIYMRVQSENWLTSPVIGLWGLIDGIIIGWIVHLFADSFTPKGIRFGFPITKKPFSFANIKGFRFFSYHHTIWLILYLLLVLIVSSVMTM